jgi:hypothetical protein
VELSFNFNSDNSRLIRERQKLERSRQKNMSGPDERLAEAPADLQERVKRVGSVLERVIASQSNVLKRAGLSLPVEFGVRPQPNSGPGCILSGNRYVIAASSEFISTKITLEGEELSAKSQKLTDILDAGPDSVRNPGALAQYAKDNLTEEDFERLPRRYPWIDEKTLEGIFLHELGHIVNGDAVALFESAPRTSSKTKRALIFVGTVALLGTIFAVITGKPLASFAIATAVAVPSSVITTWTTKRALASTDVMSRKRETAADQTLIKSPEMREVMARQFKRNTLLEAAYHLRQGKSVADTADLLQTECSDHPKSLTRWRSFCVPQTAA